MNVTVGTFNLNNLFSRFNFQADVSTAATSTVESTTKFAFSDPGGFKLREYKGRLVKEKPAEERKLIADRIKRMNLDVLPRRTQRSSKPMCLSKTSRLHPNCLCGFGRRQRQPRRRRGLVCLSHCASISGGQIGVSRARARECQTSACPCTDTASFRQCHGIDHPIDIRLEYLCVHTRHVVRQDRALRLPR